MILSRAFKNKIRTMIGNENLDGAIRELRKTEMMYKNDFELDMDKYFVLYDLARLFYDKENFEMSNHYLKELKKIFNQDNIKELQVPYHNYLWLNVNVNYENMATQEIISEMLEVYTYYNSLGKKDVAISALINVFRFQGDGDKILYNLQELLKCPSISDWNFVNSILVDCEKINHNLYIKAANIVKKYIPKFNINIV